MIDFSSPRSHTSEPVALDYSPAPPRRRKWLRRAAWLVLMLAVSFSGWRWGPRAWLQTRILYWQWQCMNYTAPPDQVVYEEEPAAANKLFAADARYSPYTLSRRTDANTPGTRVSASVYNPHPMSRLKVLLSTTPPTGASISHPGAVIFLHERTSPSGNRRLVCVNYFPLTDGFTSQFMNGYNVTPFAVVPGGLTTLPQAKYVHLGPASIGIGFPRTPPLVRVFAGQPDPNDPSHFTIRYQMWGQEDLLDGRLGDDDRVTLTPRKLPQPP